MGTRMARAKLRFAGVAPCSALRFSSCASRGRRLSPACHGSHAEHAAAAWSQHRSAPQRRNQHRSSRCGGDFRGARHGPAHYRRLRHLDGGGRRSVARHLRQQGAFRAFDVDAAQRAGSAPGARGWRHRNGAGRRSPGRGPFHGPHRARHRSPTAGSFRAWRRWTRRRSPASRACSRRRRAIRCSRPRSWSRAKSSSKWSVPARIPRPRRSRES